MVRISLVSSHNTSYLTLSLERVLVAGQTDAGPMNPLQLIQRSYLALKKHRRGLIISCVSACVQGRGRRRSIMSSRFSSRAPAGHLASTAGRLRDQPRLHRCNHSTYTSRSAFSAVVCPGGARIVVVSSPPSDPSGGRGDALKARPPRAAPDESGLSGRPGAAYNRPGRLPSDAAPWQVRWRPPPSGTVAELRGQS